MCGLVGFFGSGLIDPRDGEGDDGSSDTPYKKVRVVTTRTPDFAQRYPSLVKGTLPPGTAVAGWEIDC